MIESPSDPRHINATVDEILPSTGLAYLTDDGQGAWTVTKSTPGGTGLLNLRPGQRLDLTVVRHDDVELVSAYTPLD